MEAYSKSVIPIIESNYENLTNIEKTIADFFIQNRMKMNFSAKAVSEKLFVSEASLSRFAKKCGYRGYREFVYLYEENFVEQKQSMKDDTRMVLSSYQELLNKCYSLVDEAQIARIGKHLSNTSRVFVCGKGSSGMTAREMEHRFMRIGMDINCIVDGDLMRMRAVFQNKNTLIIGISISGETEAILYTLKKSHQNGAKTILITARNKDEFHDFCDEVVLIPSLKYLNAGNVISPQFPILLMLDIIYAYYVEQDKYRKEILHDDTLKALKGVQNKNL